MNTDILRDAIDLLTEMALDENIEVRVFISRGEAIAEKLREILINKDHAFEEAWKEENRQYGEDALGHVRYGWELKERVLAAEDSAFEALKRLMQEHLIVRTIADAAIDAVRTFDKEAAELRLGSAIPSLLGIRAAMQKVGVDPDR